MCEGEWNLHAPQLSRAYSKRSYINPVGKQPYQLALANARPPSINDIVFNVSAPHCLATKTALPSHLDHARVSSSTVTQEPRLSGPRTLRRRICAPIGRLYTSLPLMHIVPDEFNASRSVLQTSHGKREQRVWR